MYNLIMGNGWLDASIQIIIATVLLPTKYPQARASAELGRGHLCIVGPWHKYLTLKITLKFELV